MDSPAAASNQNSSLAISWQAPEREHHDKDVLWYAASVFIAVVLVAISLWQLNFLFAVFVVIAELLILFFSNELPRDVSFQADSSGLTVGSRHYRWSEFESFSVAPSDENDPYVGFHFYHSARFSFDLKILIPHAEVAKIHPLFNNYLSEVEHDDSLVDLLIKLMRL